MNADPRRRKIVSTWLFLCAALVVAMVAVGGLTRLTRSGLSIVEWKPVTGAVPPLSDEAWEQAYQAYRASPEGRLINTDLDLNGFRRIYYVEWFHRLLGRLVGLIFLVPWAVFSLRRWLSRGQVARFLAWFGLGGLQGVFGWLMVRSGLQDTPHVSPYWLTIHLLTALIVYVALLWEALDVWAPPASRSPGDERTWPLRVFTAVLAVTITWGGLMAGFKAGWLSDTFPLMNGEWVPELLWADSGAAGIASNPFLVHFTHRVLGLLVLAMATLTWVLTRGRAVVRRLALLLCVGSLVQVLLGALTVWFQVPTSVAVLHQVNAALLVGLTTALTFWTRPVAQRGPQRFELGGTEGVA